MEQFRGEKNYIHSFRITEETSIGSLGNTEEWNERRLLDMQFISDLMALAEQYPETFPAPALNEIMGIPTFNKAGRQKV